MRALYYKGAEKITFPPKPNGQTDIQTDGFATKNEGEVVNNIIRIIKNGRGKV